MTDKPDLAALSAAAIDSRDDLVDQYLEALNRAYRAGDLIPRAEVEAIRNAALEEAAQAANNHRYADDFLNSCSLRRGHRKDIADTIRALKTETPDDQ